MIIIAYSSIIIEKSDTKETKKELVLFWRKNFLAWETGYVQNIEIKWKYFNPICTGLFWFNSLRGMKLSWSFAHIEYLTRKTYGQSELRWHHHIFDKKIKYVWRSAKYIKNTLLYKNACHFFMKSSYKNAVCARLELF